MGAPVQILAAEMAQVLVPLPPLWETHMEFLT